MLPSHRRRRSAVVALGASILAAACGDSAVGPTTPVPPKGIVVLNGFGQLGLTLVPDTGTAVVRLDFGGLFDGASFTLARDSVLTTSSKGGGDLLYVADLNARSFVRLQMPAGSNPAGAAFGSPSLGGRFLVALRDSGAIAVVSPTAGGAGVSLLRNAGQCPSGVFTHDNAVWSVDANLDCARGYALVGESRLIRIVPGDARRDTIALGAGVVSAGGAKLIGDAAYVSSAGFIDFSARPLRLVSGGAVTRVDLRTRRVVGTFTMPAGSYGASTRLGGDGRLYVSYYADVVTYAERVIALDPATLTPVGPRVAGAPYLDLRRADGTTVACGATTADALGRIHCVTNGAASAATLHVFGTDGREIRSVPAGQGAYDVIVR